MRSSIFCGVLTTMVLTCAAAHAASFDCAKAKSRTEHLVCDTPQLSQLDEQLAQTYLDDQAVSPTPVGLTLAQRQWMAQRDRGESTGEAGKFRPFTADEMAHDYAGRIADLKAEIALVQKARAMTFPVADLAKRCAPLSDDLAAKCVVTESGVLEDGREGPVSHGKLCYQVQAPPEGDTDDFTRGVVVFQQAGAGLVRPRFWNFQEGAWFGAPQIVHSPQGTLLWLPATDDGTGVFNEDILYQWQGEYEGYRLEGGHWRDVDIVSWKDDLAKRLPANRQVWKGVPYDFARLSVLTHLWAPGDGNCCPTAGQADVHFSIEGDRLAIASVKLTASNGDAQ